MTVLVAIVAFLAFTNGPFDLVNIMTQGGPVNATTTSSTTRITWRLTMFSSVTPLLSPLSSLRDRRRVPRPCSGAQRLANR